LHGGPWDLRESSYDGMSLVEVRNVGRIATQSIKEQDVKTGSIGKENINYALNL